MKKRGLWTAEEVMRPVSWRRFGAMLWWALYCLSVIQILLFVVMIAQVQFFEKKVLWDREFVVLAVSVTVVVCSHAFPRRKKATGRPPVGSDDVCPKKPGAARRQIMRPRLAAFVGFAILLVSGLPAADAIDGEVILFRYLVMEEGYLVVIDSMASFRLAARFEVGRNEQGEFLIRVVTVNDGRGPVERLSPASSAEFLKKFRSFDWSAKPKRKGPASLCAMGKPTRIAFKARVDDSYREIEADGAALPSLADFLELIVVEAREPDQPSEPASGLAPGPGPS